MSALFGLYVISIPILNVFFIFFIYKIFHLASKDSLFFLSDFLRVTITSYSLAIAWIMTYPAVEVESPTLFAMREIGSSVAYGITKADLLKQMNNDLLVYPRIRDLAEEAMINIEDNTMLISAKGKRLIFVFNYWRRLTNQGIGG
jgi:hypothetical protein